MSVHFTPLLQIQRDLYRLPRSMERFGEYLRTMVGDSEDNLAIPPLVAMNPMAREHVPALIDDYLRLGAEKVAAQAVEELPEVTKQFTEEIKLGLVVLDDLRGGWTSRYVSEFQLRCGQNPRAGKKAKERALWLTVPLWRSDRASCETVRLEVLLTLYRAEYRRQHGPSLTIRQMLAQEGYCMARAGWRGPALEPEELEYTRAVIAEHLDAQDMPTAIAALFGDPAAASLGFAPLGLGLRAGLAMAQENPGSSLSQKQER